VLLQARLTRVREQGYEAMESQQVAGVTNLSVPIFGPLGSVVAALTCPYTDRLDKQDAPDQATTLKMLIAAGGEISARSATRE
jgi:DNA-binding IclR family transcriptional regulator